MTEIFILNGDIIPSICMNITCIFGYTSFSIINRVEDKR